KGTLARFHDLVMRSGGSYWKHVDMASQIIVPGAQGYPGSYSSFLMGPDLYHPGAHRFFVDSDVNKSEFEDKVKDLIPAGEVWYIEYVGSISTVFAAASLLGDPMVLRPHTTYSYGFTMPGLFGFGKPGSFMFEPFDDFCFMEHEVIQ
ncbi:MAG: hypothetical protein ACP5RW_08260, partial [bacterium]